MKLHFCLSAELILSCGFIPRLLFSFVCYLSSCRLYIVEMLATLNGRIIVEIV